MNDVALADSEGEPSYDPAFYAHLFAIEDRHFWFRGRNLAIAALAKGVAAQLPPNCRILEVGCGSGNVLRVLERACPSGIVIGVDLYVEGLGYARRRGFSRLVQADIGALPFGAPFHLIGLFDLLEHLEDDGQALRDLHRILAPQGALMVTVPAHPALWGPFDRASHHRRRYRPEELEDKLNQAGYRVEYLTQYMASILPLVWLRRKLLAPGKRHSPNVSSPLHELVVSELRIVPVVNELLAFLLAQEARLIARRRTLPLGTSLVAIARP